MNQDYYEILGVDQDASSSDIKRAYRKLAMKYHPDRNPGNKDSEQKFKEAAEAYSVLSDDQKRSRYNQFGHAGIGMGDTGTPGFEGFHMTMEDIFQQFGDIFGGSSPFEDIFGIGRQQARRRQRRSDLRITMPLDLEDIATGVTKTIKVKRLEMCDHCNGSGAQPGTNPSQCPTCKGSGQVRQISRSFFGQSITVVPCNQCDGAGEIITNPCRYCHGSGSVKKSAEIRIKAPPGVSTGNYLTLRGEGNRGGKRTEPSDLIVYFEEKEHKYFTRNGSDIITELEISFTQSALGDIIKVPTLEGKAKLTIPAGIQSGQVLRMRKKGLPDLRGSYRGDLLVRIQVVTPKTLSSKQKELLKELKTIEGKSSRTKVRKIRR